MTFLKKKFAEAEELLLKVREKQFVFFVAPHPMMLGNSLNIFIQDYFRQKNGTSAITINGKSLNLI